MLNITGLMGNQDPPPPCCADVCVLQLHLHPRVEPQRIICVLTAELKGESDVGRGPGEAGIPSLQRVPSEAHRPRPRASEASSPGAAEPPGLRRLMSRSPARPVSVENTTPPLTPQPRYGRGEHEPSVFKGDLEQPSVKSRSLMVDIRL